MKNRFSNVGKTAFGLFLLISANGMLFSCTDDYDLDETTPSFLGKSIFSELNERGNFQTTIRLIQDLDYQDVLDKTGSKTLFVANDDAYKKFFETTTWVDGTGSPVRSYEQLSLAQKKRLLNNAMLNNAYVLEMMANCPDGDKNMCLRQTGASSATDSVKWWSWDELPLIQTEDATWSNYWYRHRNQAAGGMYMAVDASTPMITHFLEGQMKEKDIRHEDVSFILNKREGDADFWSNADTENRSYIFDARIKPEGQDVVCLNGYFHELDKVLVAPSNMAEEIRTNGSTNLFSHILDRFSAPFNNKTLTDNFNSLYSVGVDTVFEKRYFANRGAYGQITVDPNEAQIKVGYPYLNYDPAWSEFTSSDSETKEKNMGAMFVPNDEALSAYFLTGGGRVLMDRYATKENTAENLEYNLDQIPLDIIQALVNNLMKNSFNETVPHKYLTIMNDARDQMFPISDGYTDEATYKSIFEKCILANNGVVYVMKRVISPADYASVIAPALYCNNTQIMRTVVRADESYIQGSTYANAPLQTYFSTYLKAMQSRFSFFIPTDEGFGTYGYIDPASLASGNSRSYMYWRWTPNTGKTSTSGKRLAIDAVAYPYDIVNGQDIVNDKPRGNDYRSLFSDVLTSTYGEVKKKLLIEMVNQHIVVHDNNDVVGIRGDQKYFLARTGAPVIVKGSYNGVGSIVNGGLQEQLKTAGNPSAFDCKITEVYDQSSEKNGYGNGMTYLLDRAMQPTTTTPYKAITALPEASKFVELCEGVNDDVLQKAGLRDSLIKQDATEQKWQQEAALYYIFLQGSKGGANYYVPAGDKLVRFFNNYRYTIYVPTNEAVEKELANGLPTWTDIEEYLEQNLKDVPEEPAEDATQAEKSEYQSVLDHNSSVKLKAQAMISTLVNFIKYHFQDESVFVDNVTADNQFMTAAIANDNYVNLNVSQTNGAITLTDIEGNKVKVSGKTNILARDSHFNATTNPRLIESSSYVVVHQIGQALHYQKLSGGRWDASWKSNKRAKAYLSKYGTQK